ncbi:MAG: DUF3179 domain-containing protein [Acidobacteria bacterium]|nr:DUF3179 domain-containing protein [Acidobacteriota bacterium]
MYAREAEGRTLTLGVSGSLWKDALIMFDRETGSLWTQVTGEALEGPKEGTRLEEIPSIVTLWGRWKLEHPDTLVLVRDEGIERPPEYRHYARDPHLLGIFGTKNPDTRLEGKQRILGIKPGVLNNPSSIAYRLGRIEVLQDAIGGTPVLVVRGPRDSSGRIFRRTAGGRELHFKVRRGRLERAVDLETGSTWNLLYGEAFEGPLAGTRLDLLPSIPAYWFAWAAFYPTGEIRPADDSEAGR